MVFNLNELILAKKVTQDSYRVRQKAENSIVLKQIARLRQFKIKESEVRRLDLYRS